jgi:hypothetical protein
MLSGTGYETLTAVFDTLQRWLLLNKSENRVWYYKLYQES